MFLNIVREQVDAPAGVEVDNFDAIFAQPIYPTLKVFGLAYNHGSYPELTDQPAAVPTRCERCDHDFVPIRSLASGAAKCVRFPMRRRITFLHSAVVAFS